MLVMTNKNIIDSTRLVKKNVLPLVNVLVITRLCFYICPALIFFTILKVVYVAAGANTTIKIIQTVKLFVAFNVS